MNLLKTLLILLIAYYAFNYLIGDVYEGYCAYNSDTDDTLCGNTLCGNTKCGGCDKNSATGLCGWNNSVSSDGVMNWAPESLKGKPRIFKYPHYYGYGTESGFHYGEPYYSRTVNY